MKFAVGEDFTGFAELQQAVNAIRNNRYAELGKAMKIIHVINIMITCRFFREGITFRETVSQRN